MNVLTLTYASLLEPEPDGAFVVSFRDLPERLTQGEDRADALAQAADALGEALAGAARSGPAERAGSGRPVRAGRGGDREGGARGGARRRRPRPLSAPHEGALNEPGGTLYVLICVAAKGDGRHRLAS